MLKKLISFHACNRPEEECVGNWESQLPQSPCLLVPISVGSTRVPATSSGRHENMQSQQIFVLVRNARSAANRRGLASIVLEKSRVRPRAYVVCQSLFQPLISLYLLPRIGKLKPSLFPFVPSCQVSLVAPFLTVDAWFCRRVFVTG
jgi:hypothetical protein